MPVPIFNYRLNRVVVPMVFIKRERVNGKLNGKWSISVWLDGVGRFKLDDETGLWERTLPPHILEIRNETEWGQLDASVRQRNKNDGWRRVTPVQLVEAIIEAGALGATSADT